MCSSLLTPIFCYSQTRAKATATVSATIINVNDTAKYNADVAKIENELSMTPEKPEIIAKKGNTKEYLLSTFESPDKKIIMVNKKEKWIYGNLAIYISNGKVDFVQIIKKNK